jgi:hypothetical protein
MKHFITRKDVVESITNLKTVNSNTKGITIISVKELNKEIRKELEKDNKIL